MNAQRQNTHESRTLVLQIMPVHYDLLRKREELRNKIGMQDQEADLIRGQIEVLAKEAGESGQA